MDLLGLTKTLVQQDLSLIEFNGEIDTKKYIFALDLGAFSHTLDSMPRYNYSITGTYFRVGVDVNLIHKDPDGNVVSFGIRYGRSRFNDDLKYSFEDPVYGNFSDLQASNTGASAGWMELNFGMRARVWKVLWMGYQARFKFGLNTKSTDLHPYEVPGYGPTETVTDKNTYWGFNYYIQIGINTAK